MRFIKANVCMRDEQTNKAVSKTYYVDAISFTEAETMIAEQLGTNDVKAMGFVNYDEFSDGDEEFWFKVILYAHTLDEVTATEKRQRYSMLCNGASVEQITQQINAIKNPEDEIVKVERVNVEGIIKK